jgi:hypothetical protein
MFEPDRITVDSVYTLSELPSWRQMSTFKLSTTGSVIRHWAGCRMMEGNNLALSSKLPPFFVNATAFQTCSLPSLQHLLLGYVGKQAAASQ